jgi:putative ABC transport system substrate-binding protein
MPLVTSRRAAVLAVLASMLVTLWAAAAGPASVAMLGPDEEPRFSDLARGLREGLSGHGHGAIEVVETRVRRADRAAAVAGVADLAGRRPTVAFVVGSELARVVRELAPEIPVVFITPGDPVEAGLVASLARPGGTATGMTFEYPELSGKRLQLLMQLTPRARRVLVVFDPADASSRQHVRAVREVAGAGPRLVEREAQTAEDLSRALANLTNVDAVLGIPGGVAGARPDLVIQAANRARVPTVVAGRGDRTLEALASYGASDADVAREAARLVDRILRGARAGEVPVERATKIGLRLNLRTAQRLGIVVPPALRLMAETVVE